MRQAGPPYRQRVHGQPHEDRTRPGQFVPGPCSFDKDVVAIAGACEPGADWWPAPREPACGRRPSPMAEVLVPLLADSASCASSVLYRRLMSTISKHEDDEQGQHRHPHPESHRERERVDLERADQEEEDAGAEDHRCPARPAPNQAEYDRDSGTASCPGCCRSPARRRSRPQRTTRYKIASGPNTSFGPGTVER